MRRNLGILVGFVFIIAIIISFLSAPTPSTAQSGPPAWAPNTAYSVGSLVTYGGSVYKCIQAHTSQVGWEPPNVPALWGLQAGTAVPTNTATKTQVGPTSTNTKTSVAPTATQTNTSVPTTTGCSAAAYSASAIYVNGNQVSYNGHLWQAKWWTQGEAPSTGGSGVWMDLGPCVTGPTATNTTVPTFQPPTKTFTPGPSATPSATTVVQSGGKRFVGYYAQWATYTGRNFQVWQIPPTLYTHINYAFSNLDASGNCTSFDAWADFQKTTGGTDGPNLRGNIGQLAVLKQKNPNLKILISVGGWTLSNNFSAVASTQAGRQTMASTCINLWLKGQGITGNQGPVDPALVAGIFDGIDIDWEYPGSAGNTNNFTAADKHNFTLLVQEIRNQLNILSAQTGKTYLISAAMNIDPTKVTAGYELSSLSSTLDYFNLMTYDFHGGFEATGPTNFLANLYANPNDPAPAPANTTWNIDSAVTRYEAAGVPANKITVGIPFYGRGWGGVPNVNNGLFQPASSIPPGTYTGTDTAGNWSYWDLKQRYIPSYGNFTDPSSKAPWLYSASTGIFITYDNPTSAGQKADYVVSHNLGGAMAWEIDDDDHTSFDLATTVCSHLQLSPCSTH